MPNVSAVLFQMKATKTETGVPLHSKNFSPCFHKFIAPCLSGVYMTKEELRAEISVWVSEMVVNRPTHQSIGNRVSDTNNILSRQLNLTHSTMLSLLLELMNKVGVWRQVRRQAICGPIITFRTSSTVIFRLTPRLNVESTTIRAKARNFSSCWIRTKNLRL